jgi:nitroreductase
MIKGSEIRKADFPIEPLLLDRWSPQAMSGEEISQEELMRLFEAARWAPSSFNAQQWRALYARRGSEHWQTFLSYWRAMVSWCASFFPCFKKGTKAPVSGANRRRAEELEVLLQ